MSSIARPTGPQQTRRLLVLLACVFSIAAGYIQQLNGLGQSPAEFAADSDETLKVAGIAFSIWGIIYLGLLAYSVRQVLPVTGESDTIRRFGIPSIVAFVGLGLWNIAAALDWEAATIVIIATSLLALLIPLLTFSRSIRALARWERDRITVVWPLALLAGWLTVATPVNVVTVLTGNGTLPTALSPTAWAILVVVGVVAVGVFVTWRTRVLAYSLPIAWGLGGVFLAERTSTADHVGDPVLAYVAAAAALILLVIAAILVFRIKPGIERVRA